MPHGDLGDQPLGGRPAPRDRPLAQSIVQPGRLAMVEHLLTGGLAHVHHRQPLKMALVHLAAQPLPRQQRGHGRPPSPAGPTCRLPPGLLLGPLPPSGWPAPPATAPPSGGWLPAAPPRTAWSPTVGPGSSPVVHDDSPSSPRARARSRSTTSTSRSSPSRPSIGVCPTWSSFMSALWLAD